MDARQYWHWLVQGLYGVLVMLENHAEECDLEENHKQRIEQAAERLKKLTQKE